MEKDIFELEVKCLSHGHREISPSPYRVLEVPSRFSLHGLGIGIIKSFDFTSDHPFGFYDKQSLSSTKVAFELFQDLKEERFPMPRLGGSAHFGVKKSSLSTLVNTIGKNSYFLFDYGDEWWFRIKLLRKKEKRKGVNYPRLIKEFGNSPQQYPSRRGRKREEREEEREIDESLFDDPETTEEFMLEPLPESAFEEFIEKLGRVVGVPMSDKVKNELKNIYNRWILKIVEKDEFPLNSGFLASALLRSSPEKEEVIKFVAALGRATGDLVREPQTLLVGTYYPIYYPIFRLARQMYALGMSDAADLVLFYYPLAYRFTDLDRDPSMVQECFKQSFKQGISGKVLVSLVWALLEKEEGVFESWRGKVKLVKRLLESDLEEETKVAISYTLAVVPILHVINNSIGKIAGAKLSDEVKSLLRETGVGEERIEEIEEDQKSTRELIDATASFETVKSVTRSIERELGKEFGEVVLPEFLEILFTDYFEYLFKQESPYGRSFIEPVASILIQPYSSRFPPVACRHALNVLLENMGKEKAVGFLRLLLKKYEEHSFKEASYVGSILNSVRDQAELFKGKMKGEIINTLEEYTDYHLLQGRKKAYQALYKLTNDEKYPKEASNDRAKKVRKWAEKTLK